MDPRPTTVEQPHWDRFRDTAIGRYLLEHEAACELQARRVLERHPLHPLVDRALAFIGCGGDRIGAPSFRDNA